MTAKPHPITLEQLARLYQARNEANKRMSQALRGKDSMLIHLATTTASIYNHTYALAVRQYKRQQGAGTRDQWRTTMIKYYLDHQEAHSR